MPLQVPTCYPWWGSPLACAAGKSGALGVERGYKRRTGVMVCMGMLEVIGTQPPDGQGLRPTCCVNWPTIMMRSCRWRWRKTHRAHQICCNIKPTPTMIVLGRRWPPTPNARHICWINLLVRTGQRTGMCAEKWQGTPTAPRMCWPGWCGIPISPSNGWWPNIPTPLYRSSFGSPSRRRGTSCRGTQL